MEVYLDKLKEFYESKNKSKSKVKAVLEPDPIEKIAYSYNKDYLKTIEDKILEEKNKMIALKYNILYSLNYDDSLESVEEVYDEIDEKIQKLKEERDKIKFKMFQKEERKKKELKQINDEIEILKFNYKEIPEDRKELYLEIQLKRDKINEILNKNRSIIVKEKNKKSIFIITTDYQPINGNEIAIENYANDESSGSNSGSNATSGSANINSVSIESENLE
jgi:vacuolar-type H+-ATPase subunit I/STV1